VRLANRWRGRRTIWIPRQCRDSGVARRRRPFFLDRQEPHRSGARRGYESALAFCLWQGADHARFLREAMTPSRPASVQTPGVCYQIGMSPAWIIAASRSFSVQRTSEFHCENWLACGETRGPLHRGRATNVGVAHREQSGNQEVQNCRKDPLPPAFDGRADVKKVSYPEKKCVCHLLLMRLICQRHAAACQHSQSDFVKAHRIAQAFRELQAGNSMGTSRATIQGGSSDMGGSDSQ